MKKIKKLLLISIVFLAFSRVYAACSNEELNEWATNAQVQFDVVTESGFSASHYAYVFSVTPPRNDIKIIVYDENNNSAEGKELQLSENKVVYGVGGFVNFEDEKYVIEVYGADNGVCAKELLKTLEYTVPPYNNYLKDRRCENSDSELCKPFTNATKDMDDEDFDKAIKKEIGDKEASTITRILKTMVKYGIYIIIPLAIVSVFYIVKIRKFKKQERDR